MSLSGKAKKRDDYTCQKCGYRSENTSRLEAHHIVPQYQGGPDTLTNLATLCKRCHDFAPDIGLIDDYETVFEIFSGTGRKPEFDLVYFGVRTVEKMADVGFEREDIRGVSEDVASIIDEEQEDDIHTPKPLIWMLYARFEYGAIQRELDGHLEPVGAD